MDIVVILFVVISGMICCMKCFWEVSNAILELEKRIEELEKKK